MVMRLPFHEIFAVIVDCPSRQMAFDRPAAWSLSSVSCLSALILMPAVASEVQLFVRVKVPEPGPYDPAADAISNQKQKALAPPGDSCNHTH